MPWKTTTRRWCSPSAANHQPLNSRRMTMRKVLQMSPIDPVIDAVLAIPVPEAEAVELRRALRAYQKEYALSYEQLRRIPACRKLMDALMTCAMKTITSGRLAPMLDSLVEDASERPL